jgi:Vibrio cholerae RfbT protein
MTEILASILMPFRRPQFSTIRPLRPPKKIYRHLRFVGQFRVRINRQQSFLVQHHGYGVETELFWEGLFNGNHDEAMRLWIKLCKEASCIFNVGANLGLFSLVAKAVNDRARVIAFEPVSDLAQKLKENRRINEFDVECEQLAVSERTEWRRYSLRRGESRLRLSKRILYVLRKRT